MGRGVVGRDVRVILGCLAHELRTERRRRRRKPCGRWLRCGLGRRSRRRLKSWSWPLRKWFRSWLLRGRHELSEAGEQLADDGLRNTAGACYEENALQMSAKRWGGRGHVHANERKALIVSAERYVRVLTYK